MDYKRQQVVLTLGVLNFALGHRSTRQIQQLCYGGEDGVKSVQVCQSEGVFANPRFSKGSKGLISRLRVSSC